jgi:hypothetical protein
VPKSIRAILSLFFLIGPSVGNFFLCLWLGLTFDNPWYYVGLAWCFLTGAVGGHLAAKFGIPLLRP